MGNQQSSQSPPPQQPPMRNPSGSSRRVSMTESEKEKYRAFPGSAFLEKTFCGSIDTTDPSEYEGSSLPVRLMKKADMMCIHPDGQRGNLDDYGDDDDDSDCDGDGNNSMGSFDSNGENERRKKNINPSAALLARALVSEVTDNPQTMKPAEMAKREYKLLQAQRDAASNRGGGNGGKDRDKAIGAPGGVGPPHVLQSVAYACTGDETAAGVCLAGRDTALAESSPTGPYTVTIGLSMSRRHSIGHPGTVTRQTAYDWNELQDRQYKYVSSTDKYGWRAGGGEKGGDVQLQQQQSAEPQINSMTQQVLSPTAAPSGTTTTKEACPDTTHIPIIQIDCPNEQAVDQVIHVLASGDIFIPHMAVQPEALSVNGVSPPDLIVRFGCERNEDLPPDEWPNWALEFMHNQLYEYFYNNSSNSNPNSPTARWMKRPFHITLARKVRWKTVKHMNRYFAHAERVLDSWREKGPQYLDPQLPHIEGGASQEEVARPHGIYLFRNGIPTNYFGPNFEPPYTTKMTRSLLSNVMDKSWDKKRREWSGNPIPRLVSPSTLLAVACGCADPTASGGFLARKATEPRLARHHGDIVSSTSLLQDELLQNSQLHLLEADLISTSQSQQHHHHQQPEEKKMEADEVSKPSHHQPQQQQQQQQQHQHQPQRQQQQHGGFPQPSPRSSGMMMVRDESTMSIAAASGTATTVVHTNVGSTGGSSTGNSSRTPRNGSSDLQMLPSPRNVSNPVKSPMFANGAVKKKKGGAAGPPSTTPRGGQPVQSPQQQQLQQRLISPRQQQPQQQSPKQPVVEERAQVVGLASPNAAMDNDPPGNKVMMFNDTKDQTTAALDRERQQHTELIAKAKQTAGGSFGTMATSSPSTKYKSAGASGTTSPRNRSDDVSSGSAVSLDYSTDGSSAFLTLDGSSLLGGQFANADQQGSQLLTPSSQHQPSGGKRKQNRPRDPDADVVNSNDDDDENDSLSLQESTSSIVPTDEELFAIGWAKAVDPRSGNYYYFSLDRSKTVWENPLTHGLDDD